jgi:hypothetical protein
VGTVEVSLHKPGANPTTLEFTVTTSVLLWARAYLHWKNIIFLKTRHAISCAVNFYNAGVVTTQGRM